MLLLALIIGLCYHHTLFYPWQYDDDLFVVKAANWSALDYFLSYSEKFPSRTVTFFTFAFNHLLSPNSNLIFNLTNLIIHLFASCGFYALARTIIRSPRLAYLGDGRIGAFVGAVFFAVHPLQIQSVTFVWQRCSSLSAMFSIWACWAFFKSLNATDVKKEQGMYAATAAVLLLFGMFSKESAGMVPVVMLTGLIAFYPGIFAHERSKSLLLMLIVLFLVVPTVQLLHKNPIATDMQNINYPVTWKSYFLTEQHVIFSYIKDIVWPNSLSLDYDFQIVRRLDLATLLATLTHIFIVTLGFLWLRRRPVAAFCILSFYTLLAMESSFIPLADVKVDHRTYLPLMSAFLFLAIMFAKIKRRHLTAAFSCVMLLAIALGWGTFNRNKVWSSDHSLWTDVIQKAPEKPRGHENLGAAYARKGNLREALKQFETSLTLGNYRSEIYEKIYETQLLLGDFEEAQRFSRLLPDRLVGDLYLAKAYLKSGMTADGLSLLKNITVNDGNWQARYLLIECLISTGDLATANENFNRLDMPEGEDFQLGLLNTRLLFAQGDTRYKNAFEQVEDFAETDYRRWMALAALAREIDSEDKTIKYLNLAMQTGALEPYLEAIKLYSTKDDRVNVSKTFDRFIAHRPNDHRILANLAQNLSDHKFWEETVRVFQRMIELAMKTGESPAVIGNLHYNIAVARFNDGKIKEAVPHAKQALAYGYQLPTEFLADIKKYF